MEIPRKGNCLRVVRGDAMKCVECREKLIGYIEGLLDEEESRQCREHISQCSQCREEYQAAVQLQQHLVVHGQQSIDISVVDPVMNRVLREKTEMERTMVMKLFHTRWGIGLSTAAAVALVVLGIFIFMPWGQVSAAEIIVRGARAVSGLDSVHMQCKVRTLPNDNFELIGADYDFVDVEIWKQFGEQYRWRIDKPERMAVMDGSSTYMVIKPLDEGMRFEQASGDAFDTKWLHEIADASLILEWELQTLHANKSILEVIETPDDAGRMKSLVAIENTPNLPQGDYLKNKFFRTADTRREYLFDKESALLESVRIYLMQATGHKLIFETVQIDYNQPINPQVFHPSLSENIKWISSEMPELPDNEYYAALTPEQAAAKLFEAMENNDWLEAEKFRLVNINDQFKQNWGGLRVIKIGESFTSMIYPGVFVPYELQFANGRIIKHNLALKKDRRSGRWYYDGGL